MTGLPSGPRSAPLGDRLTRRGLASSSLILPRLRTRGTLHSMVVRTDHPRPHWPVHSTTPHPLTTQGPA